VQVRTEGRGEFTGGSPFEKRPKIWNFRGHEIVLDDRQELLDVRRFTRIEAPVGDGRSLRRSDGHSVKILSPLPRGGRTESLPPLALSEVYHILLQEIDIHVPPPT
jgi:hypothetical protein